MLCHNIYIMISVVWTKLYKNIVLLFLQMITWKSWTFNFYKHFSELDSVSIMNLNT